MKYFKQIIIDDEDYTDSDISIIKSELSNRKLSWVLLADIIDAEVEIVNNTLIWNNGVFLSGDWHYGIFRAGKFYGIFHNGIIEGGEMLGKIESAITLN